MSRDKSQVMNQAHDSHSQPSRELWSWDDSSELSRVSLNCLVLHILTVTTECEWPWERHEVETRQLPKAEAFLEKALEAGSNKPFT